MFDTRAVRASVGAGIPLLSVLDRSLQTARVEHIAYILNGTSNFVHSVTKFLSGHSDVVQGAVLARAAELFAPIRTIQNTTGAVPSPFDCWLTLRGLKTLSLRIAQHNRNGAAVARFLEEHPAVERVYYPGFGGVVSFEVQAAREIVGACATSSWPNRRAA